MSTHITSELVKKFWKDALEEFGAKSVDKNDSGFMKAVGSFLDVIGILDKDEFLNHFTTTIFTTIYRPFDIGDGDDGWDLWHQITICVHELVHVLQYKDDPIGFTFSYVGSKNSRSEYEAKAYAADMEMHYWRYGKLYNIEHRMQSLKSYGVDQEHIDFAVSVMESIGETVLAGATVNDVAAWAMDWLEANGVQGAKAVSQ